MNNSILRAVHVTEFAAISRQQRQNLGRSSESFWGEFQPDPCPAECSPHANGEWLGFSGHIFASCLHSTSVCKFGNRLYFLLFSGALSLSITIHLYFNMIILWLSLFISMYSILLFFVYHYSSLCISILLFFVYHYSYLMFFYIIVLTCGLCPQVW